MALSLGPFAYGSGSSSSSNSYSAPSRTSTSSSSFPTQTLNQPQAKKAELPKRNNSEFSSNSETKNKPSEKAKSSGRRELASKRIKVPEVKRLMSNEPQGDAVKVMNLKGNVFYNGKKINKSSTFQLGGELKVEDGRAVIQIKKYGLNVLVRNQTTIQLFKKPGEISLLKGSTFYQKKKGEKLSIKTKNSLIQVIGTEFITLFKPMLSETEIIVFKGKVQFENNGDITDKNLIETGQWGGIGGRYSKKIGNALNLPKKFLKSYQKALAKEIKF